MRYVGSKNKLSKELVPIIQSYIDEDTRGYLEPFVGGANIIDKIVCDNKIGVDLHEELIELLKYSQENWDKLPERIMEDEYNEVKNNKEKYPKWYVGLVGFCASFGAKYFGGYARNFKGDDSGSWSKGAINNLRKQSPHLKGIEFINDNFLNLDKSKYVGYVIYCDPPYRNTTKYATENFPYEEFYQWCKDMSKDNIVLISEYDMPDEFECIWEQEVKNSLGSGVNKTNNNRVEKLFKYVG